MEPTVMRGGPLDVIAYSYYQMGYRPSRSLVLVGLRGPLPVTDVVLRVDLPGVRGRRAVLDRLFGQLSDTGNGLAVALVINEPWWRQAVPGPRAAVAPSSLVPPAVPDAGGPPGASPVAVEAAERTWGRLARSLLDAGRRHGVRVVDVLGLGDSRYRSCLCPDLACCPAEGRSLDGVHSTGVAAGMVLAGRVLRERESDLLTDVDPEPGRGWDPALVTVLPGDRRRTLDRWTSLLAGEEPGVAGGSSAPGVPGEPGEEPTWLAAALRDLPLRDAIMISLTPGGGEAARLLLEDPDRVDPERLLGQVPDLDLVERGRRPLAAVARRAPAGQRADALAVLAWLAWWAGTGARARLLAGRALADRPGHRLAGLVDRMLLCGVAPQWARPDPGDSRSRSDPGRTGTSP